MPKRKCKSRVTKAAPNIADDHLKIGKNRGSRSGQTQAGISYIEQVPAPDEWGQVFCDDVFATAIFDRLLHHCEVLSINGPSYRLKHRLSAIDKGNNTMA